VASLERCNSNQCLS